MDAPIDRVPSAIPRSAQSSGLVMHLMDLDIVAIHACIGPRRKASDARARTIDHEVFFRFRDREGRIFNCSMSRVEGPRLYISSTRRFSYGLSLCSFERKPDLNGLVPRTWGSSTSTVPSAVFTRLGS